MKTRFGLKLILTAAMITLLSAFLTISASAASVEVADGDQFAAAMEQAAKGEIDTIILTSDITSTVEKFYPAASRNVTIKSADGQNYTISSTKQLEIGITSGAYQYNKDLRANVTLQNVTFDLNNSQRAFYVSADGGVLNLDGVTIQNGKRSNNNGGAISVFGEANLTNVTILNCMVESLFPAFDCYGGAIYVEGGKLTLNGGSITNCRTIGGDLNKGGAIYLKDSELIINGTTISGNTSCQQGGGICAVDRSTITMNSGSISGNTSSTNMGGGVVLYSSHFVMNGGSISNNTAYSSGGNVMLTEGSTFDYFHTSGAVVSNGNITHQTAGYIQSKDFYFPNNESISTLNAYIKNLTTSNMSLTMPDAEDLRIYNRGGGKFNLIYTVNSNIQISNTWNISTPKPDYCYQHSSCPSPLYNYIIRGTNDSSIIASNNGSFSANENQTASKDLVSVASGAVVSFENITFDANKISGLRPLYIASGANVTLAADTLVKGGNANEKGGGVLVNGATLTLNGGAVNYNTGTYGGGVCLTNDATMTINSGELAGNTATERGGAVYLESPSSTVAASRLTINNGNIYSNCAQTRYGQGGAIYISPSSVSTKGNTVDMYGGKIYENLSRGQGVVAVRLYGVFNMYGGEIYSNSRGLVNEDKSMTANDDRGSGVYVNGGTFKMAKSDLSSSIPTIRDNTGWHGSAIDIENGTVDLSHGLITNNINRLINGNTTYYGAIFAQAGTLNIGGDISIYGNRAPTRNHEENIFVYSADMTLKVASNLTGKVGIYSKTNTTNTKVATCQSGVTSIGGLFVDNSTKSLSIDGTNVVITDNTPYFITALHSGNVLKLTSGNTLTVDYSSLSSIQGTYTDADFLGIVDVSGFGTDSVQANALYKAGDTISNITGELYAVWVKVDTIPMASAMINASSSSNAASGLKFITTVQTSQLDSIGLFAKSPSTDGDGYIRGTLLGIVGKTDLVFGGNYASDSPINNTGWLSAEKYKGYVGNNLPEGYSAYTTVLTYSNPENYNKAVSFRGYITVEVNGVSSTVYSYFNPPSVLENGDDVTYTTVHHARSARAVVRALYFKGSETKAKTSLGSNYSKALEIAGYTWDGYNTDWVNTSDVTATNYSYQPTFNLLKNTSVYGKNLNSALQNVSKSGDSISGSIEYVANYSGYTNALSSSEKDVSIAQYENGKYGYGYFLTFELYAPVSDYSNAVIEIISGSDKRTLSGASMSNNRINVALRIDSNSDSVVVKCDWDGAGSKYEPCVTVLDLTGLTFNNRSGVDAIRELALSYDRRGEWIQYETYSMSRTLDKNGTGNVRISSSAMPEDANSTNIIYLDCAGFINAVYMKSIGHALDDKESIDIVKEAREGTSKDNMYVYLVTGNETDNEKAAILADFESILQPGDVIAYAYTRSDGADPTDGHTMIYLGDGMMIHCEGEGNFTDGNYHSSSTGKPYDVEERTGAITYESIYDTLLNKDHRRYLFNGKHSFAIVRPLNSGENVIDSAGKRLSHLTGVVIDTMCSHPYGKTVAPGEIITMTYKIENTSNSYKGFTVEFRIPNGTTATAETPTVTYSSGSLYAAQAVRLQAGESTTIKLSVKVDSVAEKTAIAIKSLAANVPLNTYTVTVGSSLTPTQLNAISSILNNPSTLSASSDFDLMKKFYTKIGATLNLGGATNIYDLLGHIFSFNTDPLPNVSPKGYQGKCAFMASTADNAGQNMLAPGLFGGYRLCTKGDQTVMRIKKLTTDALMPGDIIIFSGGPFSDIPDLKNQCDMYIYLGNDTFVTYDNGVKTFTANGKDRISIDNDVPRRYLCDNLTQLFGSGVFAVLRPSLY